MEHIVRPLIFLGGQSLQPGLVRVSMLGTGQEIVRGGFKSVLHYSGKGKGT